MAATRFLLCLVFLSFTLFGTAQSDSLVTFRQNSVLLKEVVVRSRLNVQAFIKRVQEDTTFYKAFRNLKVLGYTSLNDVQIFGKKGDIKASLRSRTRQMVAGGCRWMQVLEERSTGDYYDRHHSYNYYTAELYAGLFFARDTVCGETNIVYGHSFSTKGKGGIDKHKEQLKLLFFNPGTRIPGIPFIGNKVALFDEEVAKLYDFEIDMDAFKDEMCYVFKIKPRADLTENEKDQVVINSMITWFNINTWDIVARQYDLSYNAGVYDFDVHMEVEMGSFRNYLVPKLLRYNGNWDVIFKKREKAIFTASLFDFTD